MRLVVGTNSLENAAGSPGLPPTRWPTTVHAVSADDPTGPFRTLCGVFVLYRHVDEPWPCGATEEECATCLELAPEAEPTSQPDPPPVERTTWRLAWRLRLQAGLVAFIGLSVLHAAGARRPTSPAADSMSR